MEELTIEDFKQLVTFYTKRANDAESKNAEFQLIINRLKIDKISSESKIRNLELEVEKQLEIQKLYRKPDPEAVNNLKKKVAKTTESK